MPGEIDEVARAREHVFAAQGEFLPDCSEHILGAATGALILG